MTVSVKRLRLYLSVCLGVCLWISLLLPLYVRYDFTDPSAVPSAEEHTTRSSRVHVKKGEIFSETIISVNPNSDNNQNFLQIILKLWPLNIIFDYNTINTKPEKNTIQITNWLQELNNIILDFSHFAHDESIVNKDLEYHSWLPHPE